MKTAVKFLLGGFAGVAVWLGLVIVETAQTGQVVIPYILIALWFGLVMLTAYVCELIDLSPGRGLPPSKVIGEDYLYRWHIIPRNRWFNIYLHKFVGGDDDRALHDHPFDSFSIRLKGEAWEAVLQDDDYVGIPLTRTVWRKLPRFAYRPATFLHRIHLQAGAKPVWTLFITGRRKRDWGFLCKDGVWHHWTDFTNAHGDTTGGCGETWGDIQHPIIDEFKN